MNYQKTRLQFGFGGGLTPVVKWLLISNIVIYFIQRLTAGMGDPLIRWFSLQPFMVTHFFKLWQLVTYQFLHSETSIFHIFFNMFTLWIFGCEVERMQGSRNFLRFYLLSGIGAALFHILFAWNSTTAVIGASGAIYGVLVAFAVYFPNRVVTLLLFFVLPVNIKAKHLVAFFVGISLFSSIVGKLGSSDNIAHFAHLGGALVGYLMLRGDVITGRIIRRYRQIKQDRHNAAEEKRQTAIREKRDEVDRILDRINEIGYESLSEEEKKKLRKASEFLSKEEKIW